MAEKIIIEVPIVGRHPTIDDAREDIRELEVLARRLLRNRGGLRQGAVVDVGDELLGFVNTIRDRLVGAGSPTYAPGRVVHG